MVLARDFSVVYSSRSWEGWVSGKEGGHGSIENGQTEKDVVQRSLSF